MTYALITPDASSGLPIFTWDVVTSEQHEATNEVTEFPVETGADVSDNVRQKPATCTITGEVSMTPMSGGVLGQVPIDPPFYTPSPFSSEANAIAAIGSLFSGPAGPTSVLVQSFPVPLDPVNASHQLLLDIQDAQVFCVVTTSTIEYSQMVITSVGMQRAEQGKGVFTVALKQVTTVTSASVVAPKPLIPAGLPKAPTGSPTAIYGPEQEEEKDDLFLRLAKGVAGQ